MQAKKHNESTNEWISQSKKEPNNSVIERIRKQIKKYMNNVLLIAPPIQASSAGTAHLRSVPRYKSGCNKWFKTICWFRHLFIFLLCNLCIVLFRYFFFSFKDCLFEPIVVHAFLFHFMYALTCNFFSSMHLCMNLFMEKCIYSYVFSNVYCCFHSSFEPIHWLFWGMICFLLMFCLCSLWHSLFHAAHYFMYSSGLFHLNMHLTLTLIFLFYWYICWKDFFCSFMHLFFGIPVSNQTKQ